MFTKIISYHTRHDGVVIMPPEHIEDISSGYVVKIRGANGIIKQGVRQKLSYGNQIIFDGATGNPLYLYLDGGVEEDLWTRIIRDDFRQKYLFWPLEESTEILANPELTKIFALKTDPDMCIALNGDEFLQIYNKDKNLALQLLDKRIAEINSDDLIFLSKELYQDDDITKRILSKLDNPTAIKSFCRALEFSTSRTHLRDILADSINVLEIVFKNCIFDLEFSADLYGNLSQELQNKFFESIKAAIIPAIARKIIGDSACTDIFAKIFENKLVVLEIFQWLNEVKEASYPIEIGTGYRPSLWSSETRLLNGFQKKSHIEDIIMHLYLELPKMIQADKDIFAAVIQSVSFAKLLRQRQVSNNCELAVNNPNINIDEYVDISFIKKFYLEEVPADLQTDPDIFTTIIASIPSNEVLLSFYKGLPEKIKLDKNIRIIIANAIKNTHPLQAFFMRTLP
ncbi:hypothetical protein NO2_1286 [Candidatus Termititenax persephonae]|uniref:Uncharacterized protein n=1 Tax=Candidatus Termititenax persephonae TaxID=2218525 RepID=A0A388TJY2_9BACT|nr:hypothetical protein NO2_1286 [Candidatus Termititenax persephonae]